MSVLSGMVVFQPFWAQILPLTDQNIQVFGVDFVIIFRKRECDYLNGWIRKRSHKQTSHRKMVNPRDKAWECRRRRRSLPLVLFMIIIKVQCIFIYKYAMFIFSWKEKESTLGDYLFKQPQWTIMIYLVVMVTIILKWDMWVFQWRY